ncbi:hypothetical protein So717_33100 [Roseobacter cerasinus]|uniref:DUF1772 domain-containing protein n=1 Tax=Roseobacter cerasinus TaxID=2602289 RepID=A0A640VUM7_9RHOB|nr:anthrone oxygenase family protein [Roseobacter cerasinus]GFE51557.1 hypothetical protein So717_33100 [Roseobacter cerasinus]
MSPILFVCLQLTVIAIAFVGGVFLAFSDFIMRALAHTPRTGGVQAMQSINREVFRWVFMALFLGLVPVSVLIAYGGLVVGQHAGLLLISAGAVYVVGCFGVTALCNVPMNTALADMDAAAASAQDYWTTTYLPRWTFWNSVRTVACALSAFLLLMGMSQL